MKGYAQEVRGACVKVPQHTPAYQRRLVCAFLRSRDVYSERTAMREGLNYSTTQAWVETWTVELHNELRHMAASQLARLPPGQTLQATALVHEAWLRLGGNDPRRQSRAHFFGAAAQAMRQILIDQARRKAAVRHGGGQKRVDLTESKIIGGAPEDELLAVNEALDRLATHAPPKAELVKLRYFAGLNLKEAAEVLDISEPTAKRYWAYARAWLYRELKQSQR